MAGDAVAEVKARVDIIDVVAGYVQLQRSGREMKGLCPFHAEKTPSFTVNRERQVWYCHGCGEGGDVLSFVQRVERVSSPRRWRCSPSAPGWSSTAAGRARRRAPAAGAGASSSSTPGLRRTTSTCS